MKTVGGMEANKNEQSYKLIMNKLTKQIRCD